MDGTVLIADDDKNLRNILTQALTRAGAKVRATATLSTLWRWLEEGEGDVVLTDVNLADGDALEMLPRMKAKRPDLQFVVMSAQNTVVTALRSGEAGAFDYLAKPFDLREMLQLLRKAQGQSTISNELSSSKLTADLPLVGSSMQMQEIYRQLTRILPSDLPVLIMGGPGTGKSLVAEVIHQHGPRKDLPFIRFHGNDTSYDAISSAFEKAGKGTLVFENIDEFFTNEQRQIFMLIDEGKYKCRVIATTRQNLLSAVKAGHFREDLYYRLNVLGLDMPALSERVDDVIELAEHFMAIEGDGKYLSSDACNNLRDRHWSGNVSELRMTIKRALVMSTGREIHAGELATVTEAALSDPKLAHYHGESFADLVEAHVRRFLKLHGDQIPAGGLYETIINEVEKPLLRVALEHCEGNQIKTADLLDINRNTLRKKIANLDILVTKSKKLM